MRGICQREHHHHNNNNRSRHTSIYLQQPTAHSKTTRQTRAPIAWDLSSGQASIESAREPARGDPAAPDPAEPAPAPERKSASAAGSGSVGGGVGAGVVTGVRQQNRILEFKRDVYS